MGRSGEGEGEGGGRLVWIARLGKFCTRNASKKQDGQRESKRQRLKWDRPLGAKRRAPALGGFLSSVSLDVLLIPALLVPSFPYTDTLKVLEKCGPDCHYGASISEPETHL